MKSHDRILRRRKAPMRKVVHASTSHGDGGAWATLECGHETYIWDMNGKRAHCVKCLHDTPKSNESTCHSQSEFDGGGNPKEETP